jgi:hypothetical protein
MAITRLGGANAISGIIPTSVGGTGSTAATLPASLINNTSIGNVTALPASIPTGKVLQVISSTGADYNQSNTSTSFVDVTKSSSTWETAITPSSTSSKIFVTAIMNYGITGTHAQHRITIKTQGKIGSGSYSDLANTNVLGIYSGSTEPDSNHAIAFNALWSPSTTDECKVKFVWQNSYTSSNMTTKINPSGTSHTAVTLMEVAG